MQYVFALMLFYSLARPRWQAAGGIKANDEFKTLNIHSLLQDLCGDNWMYLQRHHILIREISLIENQLDVVLAVFMFRRDKGRYIDLPLIFYY
jgi:hypothetical protein